MSAIRVLIADRDEALLGTYGRFLADHEIDVLIATSGLDCISLLRDSRPDLLVLDSGLLWGGGAGVLDRMYSEPDLPTLPVILTVLKCPGLRPYHNAHETSHVAHVVHQRRSLRVMFRPRSERV